MKRSWLLFLSALCFTGGNFPLAAQGAPQTASTGTLAPEDISQFYFDANQEAVANFKLSPAPANGAKIAYQLTNFAADATAGGEIPVGTDGTVPLPLGKLAPGFYQVTFPEFHETFGLIGLSPGTRTDPMFGLDCGLSTLNQISRLPIPQATALRPSLITSLKHAGIGMARERLNWPIINPKATTWDWEGPTGYDATRQLYEQNGIKVLELFHFAPNWTGTTNTNKFPDDLVSTAHSWATIGQHWQSVWGGLEVWNEPDTSYGNNAPADQYLPLVKAVRYGLRSAKVDTALGGGVYAYLNKPYMDTAARNGLLDECDFISFHYYDLPMGLENHITEFRANLKEYGREAKPLWITEIGHPFDGPATLEVQTSLAHVFGMDAVEAKACGIAGYFPFVYTNYAENGKNFGMMDAHMAPLATMAAYLQASRILADAKYAGDLQLAAPGLQRARVFSSTDGNSVIALYTGKVDPPAKVALPFAADAAYGVDGRSLIIGADHSVPIPDGLTYLTAKSADLASLLVTDTPAARLYAISQETPPPVPPSSSIIIQPLIDPSSVVATSRAYNLPDKMTALPIRIRINNLSDQEAKVVVKVATVSDLPTTVPPQSSSILSESIDVAKLPVDASGISWVDISAESSTVPRIAAVALPLAMSRGLEAYLKASTYQFALPIGELNRWTKLAAGKIDFTHTDEAPWGFHAQFTGGDMWAYPEYAIPQEVDFQKVTGIILRARASRSANSIKILTHDASGKQSLTAYSIIAADGEWHVAYIPLESFLGPANGDDHLATQIKKFAVGINASGTDATLEVSDLYFVGKATP